MTSDARNQVDPLGRDERDALLAAYALGELEGAERDVVERLLADPTADDARRIVAETTAVAAALRAARAEDSPPKSPHLRRAVVAALAEGRQPTPTAVPRMRGAGLSGWFALAGALAATLLVAVAVLRPEPDGRDVAALAVEDSTVEQAQQLPADNRAAESEAAVGRVTASPANPRRSGVNQNAASDKDLKLLARQADTQKIFEALDGKVEDRGLQEGVPLAQRDDERTRPGEAFGGPGGLSGAPPAAAAPAPALAKAGAAQGVQAQGGRGSAARRFRSDTEQRSLRSGQQSGDASRGGDAGATDRDGDGRVAENGFVSVADQPRSTFGIDVGTTSYALVRQFLASGRLPPADAVRIDELVNHFSYAYPQPAGDEPFAVALEVADCPWRPGHRLVRIGIAGRDIDRSQRLPGEAQDETGTALAEAVTIQVEFNPAEVASYRLIGSETLPRDTAFVGGDRPVAAAIGAGHTATALYEIVPAGAARTGLPTVTVRSLSPGGDTSVLGEFRLADGGGGFDQASADTRFAAAVAAFGMLLRDSAFKGDATFATVAQLAGDALGPDEGGSRAEFLDLVRQAEGLKAAEHR